MNRPFYSVVTVSMFHVEAQPLGTICVHHGRFLFTALVTDFPYRKSVIKEKEKRQTEDKHVENSYSI